MEANYPSVIKTVNFKLGKTVKLHFVSVDPDDGNATYKAEGEMGDYYLVGHNYDGLTLIRNLGNTP